MASSNKTPGLALNAWIGSDVPKMADFNADNALLDTAFSALGQRVQALEEGGGGSGGGGNDPRLDAHLADGEAHLSAQDRETLNQSAPVIGTYTGDGNPFQAVVTGFRPRYGVVFGAELPIMTLNAAGNAQFTHFGVMTRQGCTSGVETLSTGFKALQLGSAGAAGQTSIGLNQSGQQYVYLVWR